VADSVDSNPTIRSSMTRALPAIAFTLLVGAVWSDPLLARRSFAGRDLIAYNLPMEKAIHDAYARGRFPLWVAEVSGGRPLLPNPNAGALYPLRILLAPLPFPVAAKLFTALHWALAGLGVLALARALRISRSGGWIAAVTYVFSGVVVSDVFFPHVLPGMALLPWVVWGLRREGSTPSRTFWLALFFALELLAGDVFTIGMAGLAALGWIVVGAAHEERKDLALACVAAGALAVLAALPQIAATLLWIPETNRAVTGVTWREALQFAVAPLRLLELVIPYPFGALWTNDHLQIWGWRIYSFKVMGLFLTLYAGSLGAIALVIAARRRTAAARFGLFCVAASVLFSVSWVLVPASWRDLSAPLALRNPEKFALLLAFGLALLSGDCVDALRARARLPRWILWTGAGLALLAIAATMRPQAAGRLAVAAAREDAAAVPVAARTVPAALVEGAWLWVLTAVGLELARGRGLALLAGLVLLTAVPVAATRRIGWTFREEEVFAPPVFARFQQKRDPGGRYRALGEMAYRESGPLEAAESGNDLGFLEIVRRNFDSHSQVLWGRGAVLNADFDNGDFSRVESVRRLSGTTEKFRNGGGTFLGSLALRWGVRYRDQAAMPGYAPVGGHGPDAWDENPEALPDIRLATAWREEPDVLSALRDLGPLEPGEIVLETGRSARGQAPPGVVRVVEQSPERLILETQSSLPGWLFVLRGFWRHRTVRVDGREVDVVPAQLAFSAIAVPAGSHRVEWTEALPGWSVSRFGPGLYAGAMAALWIVSRRRGPAAPTGRSAS
jgi:hypothetical protein